MIVAKSWLTRDSEFVVQWKNRRNNNYETRWNCNFFISTPLSLYIFKLARWIFTFIFVKDKVKKAFHCRVTLIVKIFFSTILIDVWKLKRFTYESNLHSTYFHLSTFRKRPTFNTLCKTFQNNFVYDVLLHHLQIAICTIARTSLMSS